MNSRRGAHVSGLTFTMEPTRGVGTHGIGSTRLCQTLVNINAYGSFGVEAVFTKTLAFGTLRVGGAIEVRFAQNRYVNLCA